MIVGIDLGTTNTVVAFADRGDVPRVFAVPQLVADGQLQAQPQLPSFLYAPTDAELPAPALQLTVGEGGARWVAGAHARTRAAEVPHRSVSSAKSWLCHGGVDRRAAILPWQLAGDPAEGEGEGDRPRISPLDASAMLLEQVRRSWDAAHPKQPLREQRVVLTVPASFDAVARELTVQAASACGLEVRLLEEPQAAFYDLMRVGGDAALAQTLRAVDGDGGEGDDDEALVLVCDVGGGTTDLSLMRVSRTGDGVAVDRVAVGRHLLLGGDNMDLALAHSCEPRLVKEGDRLDPKRFAELAQRCRAAKEQLLGSDARETARIALASRGSKLVGGALRTELTREEVERIVLDGFFPEVDLDRDASAAPRTGIVAFGLPYERDVAITRHLAAFLRKHVVDTSRCALLLNGGVFRSPVIAARLRSIVARWTEGRAQFLEHTDPDTSVALGAVSYGMALEGKARKIGGGAARSYYLGVAGAGAPKALCVLPKGSEEGAVQRAAAHPLELTVGRKVRFDLYASDRGGELDAMVSLDDDYDRLAPLVTTLSAYGDQQRLGVVLEAELSAIGTLELSAVESAPERADKPRRFALAFDLRHVEGGAAAGHEEASAAARYGKRLDEARGAIEQVYSKKTRSTVQERDVKGLMRALEKIFSKRAGWDATLTRTLYDILWTHHKGRRVSVEHERMFWMLAGYCLRPGIGHAKDEERSKALFGLFDQRLAQAKELRGWQQFWIAWRRVAAGLNEKAQTRLRDAVDPFLAPPERGLKKPKPFRNDAVWEMLELAASLERVAAERRGELGGWILERTWTERDPRLWSALGRVGARLPTYGSAHHVVAARTIERWMDHLLREKWDQIPTAPRAAVAMCRVTGDRARDLSDATRAKVAQRLEKLGVDESLILPVRELVALDDADRADFYGEGLPAGLGLQQSA